MKIHLRLGGEAFLLPPPIELRVRIVRSSRSGALRDYLQQRQAAGKGGQR